MENYSMHLPSYSIGSRVYDKIPEICEPYGTKVIAIGGHKAINAAKDKIVKNLIWRFWILFGMEERLHTKMWKS